MYIVDMARKFPIGIQTFSKIREMNAIYVDKTELVYKLAHDAQVYFLARPRRFGKSLLISTLDDYFSGRKELFTGLAMEKLETEWKKHPVLRFDFSRSKYTSLNVLQTQLNSMLSEYESIYGKKTDDTLPSVRLQNVILAAEQKFGEKVVFLVDEYDAPLLDTLVDKETFEAMRQTLRDFYSPLKSLDPHLRFIFITGITKFSQLSIFSELNNLKIISMLDEYATLCGISEEELHTQMKPEIEAMAQATNKNFEQVCEALKKKYDGYHFSKKSPDIYNPFSVMQALQDKDLTNYWFETGTPAYLIEQIRNYNIDPETFARGIEATAEMFNVPAESNANPIPVLYQSGYLTIKDYDPELNIYTLAYPNDEVTVGFSKCLMPYYALPTIAQNDSFQIRLVKALHAGNIEEALLQMRAFFSSIPYDAEHQDENHYKFVFWLIFRLLTEFNVKTEERSAAGRSDAVVETKNSVYLFEFKLDKNGSADDALKQIDNKDYLIPYTASLDANGNPKKLFKIGVSFDAERRTLGEWKVTET